MKPNRNAPCPCGSGKKYKHCCERKVEVRLTLPAAEFQQLHQLFNSGRYAEVETLADGLLKRFPDVAEVWELLAMALQKQGKATLTAYQKAAELNENDADAHFNLAVALKNADQLEQASASYRRALAIKPHYFEALSNLGNLLRALKQPHEAIKYYQMAIQVKPDAAFAHNGLGSAYKELAQFDEALLHYKKAIKIEPSLAEAHNNLGIALREMGQFNQAELSCRHTISLRPNWAEAHQNLGNVLAEMGEIKESLTSYRKALEISPDNFVAYSSMMFALNYSLAQESFSTLVEALQYGKRVSQKVTTRFTAWQGDLQPQYLRVGVVSADLYNHPVGYFLESFLTQLDLSRLELIAYTNSPKEDDLTRRIKPHFAHWREIYAL
ncbi:MAG: tetratricopeptide repeat protein, partial [Gallionella sp.]